MKYFYGIDKTNEGDSKPHGEEFVVEKVPSDFAEPRNKLIDEIAYKLGLDSLKFSRGKSTLLVLSLFIAVFGIIVIIKSFTSGDGGLIAKDTILGKNIWILIVTAAATLYCAYSFITLARAFKKINARNVEEELEKLNALNVEIMKEMKVPADSDVVDVFAATFKDGKQEINSDGCDFSNYGLHAYVEGKCLYFYDGENKFAFDLSSFTKISTFNEKVSIFMWNKDVPYTDEKWKKYGLGENKNSCITVPRYHILELDNNGTPFGICFGNYDLPVIERLTGLKA